MPKITRLVLDWSNGNKDALDQLTPMVHSELHRIAGVESWTFPEMAIPPRRLSTSGPAG